MAQTILRHWTKWLPWSIRGSLPHRSARDISFALESLVEQALADKTQMGGFSFDVVKCFNQIPRVPLRRLLRHMGLPACLLHLWFDFLSKMERAPSFNGSIGTGLGSTTGVPEGDPLSVVAMVGICWLVTQRTAHPGSHALTFVDNLSWVAYDQTTLEATLLRAIQFCEDWALPIDWTKSFCWATTKNLQHW